MRVPAEQALLGGESDCRNKTLHQMFLMINLGERAGSCLPKIRQGWEINGGTLQLFDSFEPYNQTRLEMIWSGSGKTSGEKLGENRKVIVEAMLYDSSVTVADSRLQIILRPLNVDYNQLKSLFFQFKLIIIGVMKIFLEIDEQDVAQHLGLALRSARIKAEQTQDELAARIGVSRWTFAAMEKGDPKVSLAAWIKVSGLLGLLAGWDSLLQEPEDPFVRYDQEQAAKDKLMKRRVRK